MDESIFRSPFSRNIGFFSIRLSNYCNEQTLIPLLHPAERKFISQRIHQRSGLEFCLGRIAASKALQQLNPGIVEPILENESGALIWPNGFIGSISYSETHALAAVARTEDMLSLGLDLKPLKSSYSISAERYESHDSPVLEPSEDFGKSYSKLLCLYSAKQSVVNALKPLCANYISYLDIKLRWDSQQRLFKGMLTRSLGAKLPMGLSLEVGCLMHGGYVFSHFSLNQRL